MRGPGELQQFLICRRGKKPPEEGHSQPCTSQETLFPPAGIWGCPKLDERFYSAVSSTPHPSTARLSEAAAPEHCWMSIVAQTGGSRWLRCCRCNPTLAHLGLLIFGDLILCERSRDEEQLHEPHLWALIHVQLHIKKKKSSFQPPRVSLKSGSPMRSSPQEGKAQRTIHEPEKRIKIHLHPSLPNQHRSIRRNKILPRGSGIHNL